MRPILKTQTQPIDEFIIQVGSSAKKNISKKTILEANAAIKDMGLHNLDFTFAGLEGGAQLSASGREVAQRTMIAAVSQEAYQSAGMGNINFGLLGDIDDRHLKFLRDQGINVKPGASKIMYVSPEAFGIKRGISGVVAHEIGHSTSRIAGARDILTNAQIDFEKSIKDPSQSFETIHGNFKKMMTNFGLEEARAESVYFETSQKRLLKLGKTRYDINKELLDSNLEYVNPAGFKGHTDRYESLLKEKLENLGDDATKIKGPLSGKVGLPVEKLIEEISMEGRLLAAGSAMGSVSNISGEAGNAARAIVSQQVDWVREKAAEAYEPGKVQKIMDTLEGASKGVIDRGARVSISESGAAIVASQPVRKRLPLLTAGMADNLGSSTVRKSGMLAAATRASESVAAKNSIGMRIAGAAATILRRKIF